VIDMAMTASSNQTTEYVTAVVGEQLFGLPISRVQDVFVPARMTPVPLAAPEIAGLINLRGRVVTMIAMRRRLDLGPSDRARRRAPGATRPPCARTRLTISASVIEPRQRYVTRSKLIVGSTSRVSNRRRVTATAPRAERSRRFQW